MIKTETIVINGNTYVRTYSDAGRLIARQPDGEMYIDAVDPESMHRAYTETDEMIADDDEDADPAEVLRMIAEVMADEEG